jgi:hypothetical protein
MGSLMIPALFYTVLIEVHSLGCILSNNLCNFQRQKHGTFVRNYYTMTAYHAKGVMWTTNDVIDSISNAEIHLFLILPYGIVLLVSTLNAI